MEAFINSLTTDPINTLIYLAIVVIVIYAAIKIGGVLLKIGLTLAAIYLIFNLWSTGIENEPRLNNLQPSNIVNTQHEPITLPTIPTPVWNNTPHP